MDGWPTQNNRGLTLSRGQAHSRYPTRGDNPCRPALGKTLSAERENALFSFFRRFFPSHTCRACVLPVCATQNATNQPHRKENENNHLKSVTKLRFRMPSGSIWFISFCCSIFMVQFEANSPIKCCLLKLVVEVSIFWVSQCLSVCNSSPCSEQSLPQSGLQQEQYPQHAQSSFEN